MERILVNSNQYNGKYVAIENADNSAIAGAGLTPKEALDEAKKRGVLSPFLLYVPDKDIVHIYYAY